MKREARQRIFIIFALLLIFVMTFVQLKIANDAIEKKAITICADEDCEKPAEKITKKRKALKRYYTFTYSDNAKKADVIITSDFSKINSSNKYEIVGHSPLIFVMKQSPELNKYSITESKKGWLISKEDIKGTKKDVISCDFSRIVDVIASGGNWSDLGGPNKEIKLYCPKLDTVDGQLFKSFLLLTLNEGRPEPDETVVEKVDAFFNSLNVHQVTTNHIPEEMPDDEIYVMFEKDVIRELKKYSDAIEVSLIYPEVTIEKLVYFQAADSNLFSYFTAESTWTYNISDRVSHDSYYRLVNADKEFLFENCDWYKNHYTIQLFIRTFFD